MSVVPKPPDYSSTISIIHSSQKIFEAEMFRITYHTTLLKIYFQLMLYTSKFILQIILDPDQPCHGASGMNGLTSLCFSAAFRGPLLQEAKHMQKVNIIISRPLRTASAVNCRSERESSIPSFSQPITAYPERLPQCTNQGGLI